MAKGKKTAKTDKTAFDNKAKRYRDAKGRFVARAKAESVLGKRRVRKEAGPPPKPRTREVPHKAPNGRWRHRGRYVTEPRAKTVLRQHERTRIVNAIAKRTGESPGEVRRFFKGVPTQDIMGDYRGYDRRLGRIRRTDVSEAQKQRTLDRFGLDLQAEANLASGSAEQWKEVYPE